MLLAGEIGKPHGTNGEVYLIRISDDPQRFSPGATLLHEDGRELVIAAARAHRDRFLVLFEGSSSREDAEALRGALYVEPGTGRELEEAEYWEHELVGCLVLLEDGTELGAVTDVIVRPAQDLIEVETTKGTRLLPFVDEIVTQVDVEGRRVIVSPPEGLLD